jgi:hypothetical protein
MAQRFEAARTDLAAVAFPPASQMTIRVTFFEQGGNDTRSISVADFGVVEFLWHPAPLPCLCRLCLIIALIDDAASFSVVVALLLFGREPFNDPPLGVRRPFPDKSRNRTPPVSSDPLELIGCADIENKLGAQLGAIDVLQVPLAPAGLLL